MDEVLLNLVRVYSVSEDGKPAKQSYRSLSISTHGTEISKMPVRS
jgi:hypothetical protein